ncbi:Rne/Rng family ribonuclease [Manganibacter manganicus]|uniref:Ribonuclease E n=1 Tax=Manganibacter manganicus TaxID=1873176 RepID=A0A1V8RTX8_9HYPH|nr:Rne/Rng family ribonuclease [Pseudaminobacter manganicus]OQM76574.1 ribonuclease [Pseudaminobacter manganicus]
MPNKMLIDASHPEETRVVVVRGNRIEEFDFESQDKKQLKGNIYLARVTRVEPSLQAAFVEYGGNRHGFLAFSEIHPDYYQIPIADRQALLRAEAEEAENDDHDEHDGEERHERGRGRRGRRRGSKARPTSDDETNVEAQNADSNPDEVTGEGESDAAAASEHAEGATEDAQDAAPDAEHDTTIAAKADADVVSEEPGEDAFEASDENQASDNGENGHDGNGSNDNGNDHHEVESVGAEDALDEARSRRKPLRRQYKIQEVIKRRQILLVQVVKEERGNKGAALTTYLSLAGRYSVLMPNTARGGGISRKITNVQDRKRLKEVVADLEVPQGMGVILRTAGESRTKAEIKRDYEYLMRLWENVRGLTLHSTAPALVYEEGSLIKRSVRDLYNKDINEILVAGEDGYREAKDFMRMLMPSHAKVVQPYREATPILVRSGIEAQLDRMLQPQVTLKSGGYLIINQTEALVAIDVNSGRSTKEHSIEETALHTNLEAAEEVSRQLRLRDLAGLIVIDFIDMEENRNNRAVEKKLKDCLKNDRARIQVGRISHFGLMEMSRQRIRASVLESTMKPCPHCGGTGHVRSDSSVALTVVRGVEEFLLKDSHHHIVVRTPAATALYVLNHKRSTLVELENRFGLTISVEADESVGSQYYVIARGAVAEKPEGFVATPALPVYDEPEEPDVAVEEEEDEVIASDEQPRQTRSSEDGESRDGEGRDRKRRRRRRRRGGKDRDHDAAAQNEEGNAVSETVEANTAETGAAGEAEPEGEATDAAAADTDGSEANPTKKRRRGKRGGKRNHREGEDEAVVSETATGETDTDAEVSQPVAEVAEATAPVAALEDQPVEEPAEEKPKKPRRTRSKKAAASTETGSEPATGQQAEATPATENGAAVQPKEAEAAETEPAKPRRTRRKPTAAASVEPVVSSITVGEPEAKPAEEKPKRAGWWQRKGFF